MILKAILLPQLIIATSNLIWITTCFSFILEATELQNIVLRYLHN